MFEFLNLSKLQTVNLKFRAIQQWITNVVNYQQPLTLTAGSSIEWNVGNNYNAQVTLTSNATLSIIGLKAGCYGSLVVVQGGSGSYTLTLPSSSKVSNGGAGAVTLSTGVGDIDIIGFYYDGTYLYWNIQTDFT